jgi:lauroyl-KDO2-lipid IV(A) myristoyltransferase
MTQRTIEKLDSPYPPPFSKALLKPRHWPTLIGLGLLWLLIKLPRGMRASLGDWLGEQTFQRNRKRAAIVRTNIAWCYPEKSEEEREALARSYFRNMAHAMLEYGFLWWGSERAIDKRIVLEGEEHVRDLIEASKPIILLTCHHVALDAAGIAYNRKYPVVSIFKEVRDPVVGWFMANGRNRFGGVIYERSDNLRPLIRATKKGYSLYYLPDEDFGPEKSVFAPFFNIETATIPALSRLTRMCNAAVVPYMAYYDPDSGNYRARLFAPLENFPSGDEVADAARMNEALEMMIRIQPDQYMWSMRIFQTRPNGAPPPYEMKGKAGSGHRELP